jgi:hypothetical protein
LLSLALVAWRQKALVNDVCPFACDPDEIPAAAAVRNHLASHLHPRLVDPYRIILPV